MDTIWTIMTCIVYGFELLGLATILTLAVVVIFNEGTNDKIDRIRNWILMLDEEDFE